MSLRKEIMDTGCRWLLIFCNSICLRRALPKLTEGSACLFLSSADTGLLEDKELWLKVNGGCWMLEGRELNSGFPFYLYTEEKEELLFLLSDKTEILKPSEKILLRSGECVQIGNTYTNQIFYECFSFISAVHAEIICNKPESIIIRTEQEGVYVNGNGIKGEKILYTGDKIDIYGLHLLMLGEFLVCVSFCGIFRCVERKNLLKEIRHVRRMPEINEGFVKRSPEREQPLCTGEIELVMPEQTAIRQEQPLFLSLGPTLTMILPMLLMAELGSKYMGGTGNGFYYMSLVMSLCTAFLGVFWGLVNRSYRRCMEKREKREKERQYREYLRETESYLLECQKENQRILEQKYPSLDRLYQKKEKAVVWWNRYYKQKDFLFLRLGIGEMDFQIKIIKSGGKGGIRPGKLEQEAEEMAGRFARLKGVPVGVDLYENRQIGLIGQDGRDNEEEGQLVGNGMKEMLLQIFMQIAACHCYTEVKIACFYRKEKKRDREIVKCLKWLPHCWSCDGKVRFLSGDEQEAAEILPVLLRELVKGACREQGEIRIPWYVVVVLNKELIAGEPLYQCLTEPKADYPVSAVFVGKEAEALPKSCRYFLLRKGREGEVINSGIEQVKREKFLSDACNFSEAKEYARGITGFRVREQQETGLLPESVDFLMLYGCSRVEELECGHRWQLARPQERLKAVIGCRAGGQLVCLDVHERFHGPHGLVAGTTGSGKSELLQTYLLSLAISYSPSDVNFFVIDYKGGGTGNVLKTLPHCAGVISNLSGRQIKRAMLAIASENKRRQRLLGEYEVNHIDAYSRLYRSRKASKPMPHLILVIDEFAELKKEEPEFMQEIVSLAQVGRSLGMHLILATQKPAGIVDDKIWSNARFRLCLRVQDKQDSMDMLKNGDAAALTVPGQCYIQIGNQEYYELFQAGYCGGSYQESKEKEAGAVLVSATGKRRIKKDKKEGGKEKSQMQALVQYVSQVAEEYGYDSAPQLWLPELPEQIFDKELRRQNQDEVEVALGLCDDPENQRQFPLFYQPLKEGHLAICGSPGTGKTSLLQTILWQLCSEYRPKEVQSLAVSMGQESFGCFQDMPGCIGILKERENKEIFLYHLRKLSEMRRERLNGISFQQHNQLEGERLPYVFLVIDNFGSFSKELNEKQEEFILKLASEGISLGIYLILSAAAVNEIGSRIFEKIKTTVALEMSDRFQYGDILRQYYLPVLPGENKKGRGLCRVEGNVLEFQSALAIGKMEDYERINVIKEAGSKRTLTLKQENIAIPLKIPVLPKKPDFMGMLEDFKHSADDSLDFSPGRVPLGYDVTTGEIKSVLLKESTCFLISGNEKTGRRTLLSCMIEGFLQTEGVALIIDNEERLRGFQERREIFYSGNGGEDGKERIREIIENGERHKGIFISDMGSFCHFLSQPGERKKERNDFWCRLTEGKVEKLLLVAVYNPFRDMEAAGTEFFRKFIAGQRGICLGGNVAAHRVFDFDDLNYSLQNRYEAPGTGYLKEGLGSRAKKLLLPEYRI